MSQLPRNQRRKARLKRNVSILSRSLRNLQNQHGQTQAMLLALLAQAGGEVTVTADTLNQVLPKLSTLGWQTAANPDAPGEFVVRLVNQDATDAEKQQAQDAADASVYEAPALVDAPTGVDQDNWTPDAVEVP